MRASVCNNVPCMSRESDQYSPHARCSPLSFFDLLLEGACFFFRVWAWLCSLHRRSWKLINFHIMKAWVRQMAARTVILQEKGNSDSKKNALMLIYNEFHTWCRLNLELAIIAAPHNISLCLNAPRKKRGRILSVGFDCAWRMSYCKFDSNCI